MAIYLSLTNLKSVSSMKLHRDLDLTQKSAWHLAHRLRKAFEGGGSIFVGPVEVAETYMGGRRVNMPKAKLETMTGRRAVGKTAVVGAKVQATNQVRAQVVERADKGSILGFVARHATIYSDDALVLRIAPKPPSGSQSQRSGVRPERRAHERNRVLLEHAQAGAQGNVPQDEPEASQPLHPRVRRQAQPPRPRYSRPHGGRRHRHGLKRLKYDTLTADNGLDSGARTA